VFLVQHFQVKRADCVLQVLQQERVQRERELADAAAARSTAALLGQVCTTATATIIVICVVLTIILVALTPQLDEALTELLLARGDSSSAPQPQQQQLRGRAAADESHGNAERADETHAHKSNSDSLGTAAGESDDDDVVVELNRCNTPSSSSVAICASSPSLLSFVTVSCRDDVKLPIADDAEPR
jgi:hypothetical protein